MALDPGDRYLAGKFFHSEDEAKTYAGNLNSNPIGADSVVRYDAAFDPKEDGWRVYMDKDGPVEDMVGGTTFPRIFAGKLIYSL